MVSKPVSSQSPQFNPFRSRARTKIAIAIAIAIAIEITEPYSKDQSLGTLQATGIDHRLHIRL